jgi:protoporphyrinogen oxidase
MEKNKPILVIGAGPAGLAAAQEILKNSPGAQVTILEKESQLGGICKTYSYRGYKFDAGGHRFFTKNDEVDKIWRETLGDDFIQRNRLSRIFYNGKFYDYPLKLVNVLKNLGLIESFRVLGSYLYQKIHPYPSEKNLEQWIINRFGRRLYDHFFKSYTEKLWGRACADVGSDWGAQRIKNLSVMTAIKNALFPGKNKKKVIKTLIDSFDYPRLGVGQMYEKMAENIIAQGGKILKNTDAVKLFTAGDFVTSMQIKSPQGLEIITVGEVISSMPLSELVLKIDSSSTVAKATAEKLKYRSFLSVCLIMRDRQSFPDNWIYVHSKEVKMGRIQNFRNWSPEMVPEADKIALGLEYFCNEGDEFWNLPDQELIKLGLEELEKIGLGKKEDFIDGFVGRSAKAYPVYDSDYSVNVEILKNELAHFKNLQTIGRNGLFRYNNMDHSILAGLFAARNVTGSAGLDVWSINVDEEYHEKKFESK